MPPKKKTAAQKVQKQEAPAEMIIEPEPTGSSFRSKKIPRGPIFRRNVDDNKIRVKLWKVLSCKLKSFPKGSTTKKSFKNLKKLKIHHSYFHPKTLSGQFIPFLKFCESLKLDSLHLVYDSILRLRKFKIFRAFRNSRFKDCFLESYCGNYSDYFKNEIEAKFVNAFRRFKKCNLFLRLGYEQVFLLLNTQELISWKRLHQSSPFKLGSQNKTLSSWIAKNIPKCVEQIHLKFDFWQNYRKTLNLPSLPNLKKLSLDLGRSCYSDENLSNISFIKQSQMLESLSIQLENHTIDSLDYLADLAGLKDFSFAYKQTDTQQKSILNLPTNLKNLENIRFDLKDPLILSMENIQNFILNNQNLRTLGLNLSIQNLGILFEGEDLFLPHLETLSINMTPIQKPYVEEAQSIAQFLKKHHFVKKLQIQIEQSHADLNEILLQGGLAHMKSVEDLTLKYEKAGGHKGKKFEHLKGVFENLVNLTSLELDVTSDLIRAQEVKSFLEDLGLLKNLQKWWLSARFLKLTRANLGQLSSYLVSTRDFKNLQIKLKGISEKDEKELKNNLFIKSALTTGAFSFDPKI